MREIVEKIYGLEFHKAKYTLKNMLRILNLLGNPQLSYKTIHVTGTNGKGSTSNFISNILSQKYKVGLYTSPHFIKYNERFKINGKPISDYKLKKRVLELQKILEDNGLTATFFEFTTALSFLHFKKEKVDFAVIEVGVGGKLDATNVLSPVACVITNIGLDHTTLLGTTRLEIAKDKAQIIKAPVFTAEKDESILEVFKAKKESVKTISTYKKTFSDLTKQRFVYLDGEYTLSMLGEHQISNACIAIEVSKYLKVAHNYIRKGLLETKVRGRLDVVSQNPLIILDGAHNEDGFKMLLKFLQNPKEYTLIIGLSENKDVHKIAELIKNKFKEIIITKSKHKPMQPKQIQTHLPKAKIELNPNKALKQALKTNNKIIITGSLYLLPLIER